MDSASTVNTLMGGNFGFKAHIPDSQGAAFKAGIALEARPDPVSGLSYDLSMLRGLGLQFGLIRIEANLTKDEAVAQTTLRNVVFNLAPKAFAFDNFVSKLIPGDGLRVEFDVALGRSSRRGSFIEGKAPKVGTGGARPAPPAPAPAPPGTPPGLPPLPQGPASGIGIELPIGKSLGPVTIHDVKVAVDEGGTDQAPVYIAEVTTSASVKIGPVIARVDRFGVKLEVSLPSETDARANLGFANLEVAPRAPDGIALGVDYKGYITGGGFLFHDRAQSVYAGVLQLTIQDRFTLKAFGLLATKLPDGSDGYSLIVFITADDFRPYPARHGLPADRHRRNARDQPHVRRSGDARGAEEQDARRTCCFRVTRSAARRRSSKSLATVFPARKGSYLFGPLARIVWGRPVMVVFDLAAILEWGERWRLIILGRISSILPSQTNDLVRLNLDAVGLIDFGEGRLEIDAVLVDSRIARKFVLTGSAALRMNFGRGPGTDVRAVGRRPASALRAARRDSRSSTGSRSHSPPATTRGSPARPTTRSPPTPSSTARTRASMRRPAASRSRATSATTC